MRTFALAILATLIATPAAAEWYAWPLRDTLAHDGDTPLITMPGLPPELRGKAPPRSSWPSAPPAG